MGRGRKRLEAGHDDLNGGAGYRYVAEERTPVNGGERGPALLQGFKEENDY